jgi:hypothetical protein
VIESESFDVEAALTAASCISPTMSFSASTAKEQHSRAYRKSEMDHVFKFALDVALLIGIVAQRCVIAIAGGVILASAHLIAAFASVCQSQHNAPDLSFAVGPI